MQYLMLIKYSALPHALLASWLCALCSISHKILTAMLLHMQSKIKILLEGLFTSA